MAYLALHVMKQVEPEVAWRVIRHPNDQHSTCWDGGDRIYDTNYMALRPEMSADDTFVAAGGVKPAAKKTAPKK